MKLVILGSGTAVPTPHKGPTAAWLSDRDTSLMVDCGSGSVQKLIRAGADLNSLDALLLTHAHLDHIGDLTTLLFALRMPGCERDRPLRIFHSQTLRPYIEGLRTTFGDWLEPLIDGDPLRPAVLYEEIEVVETTRVRAFEVSAFAVRHHETSLGYRFRDLAGATLAIPSDTGPAATLVAAAKGVDCLVVECSQPDEARVDQHMTPSRVTQLISQARPASVILTHLYPAAERADVAAQVRAAVSCPVFTARDGLALRLSRGGAEPIAATAEPKTRHGDEIGANGARSQQSEASQTRERAAADPMSAWLGDDEIDAESVAALIEADLDSLDAAELAQRKYDHGPAAQTPKERVGRTPTGRPLRFTAESLTRIRLDRAQKKLVKRARSKTAMAELNLRGSTVEVALRQLDAAVQTWARERLPMARVVTGKGRRSEAEPVVKLAVLNWLSSVAGQRHVVRWAPEMSPDGRFGSLVVELRR